MVVKLPRNLRSQVRLLVWGNSPGDPLADIKLMTNVTFVMKAGTIYKQ